MSIIIVDDNEINLIIVDKILRNAGYNHLRTVSSAVELFDLLELNTPSAAAALPVDLILMDLMMPEIDGVEACRRILRDARYMDTPIIFVTAVGDSNKLAEALDAGAVDYVMKPIIKVELLARIRSALRLKFEKDRHKERDKRLNDELDLANQVQRSVLSQPIDNQHVNISAVYLPSFELAGDFYAWYPIDRGRYGIILLDMMGHGISSSLVCMYVFTVLQDTIKRITDPVQVIHELNRYMNRLYTSGELIHYYFTAIYLVLDTDNKTIEYVNAGHPPGLMYFDNQTILLTEGCCAVGLFEHIEISKGTVHYEDSAKLVLYTDGLAEVRGTREEFRMDGMERLIEDLKLCQELDLDALAAKFIPTESDSSQQDDICVIMITTK